MTETSENAVSQRLELVAAEDLTYDDEAHVRSDPANASRLLTENIQQFGIVEAVHARQSEGSLLVFDGWRRVCAARAVSCPVPVLIYTDMEWDEALSKSLILNDKTAGVEKSVTGNDRDRSVSHLAEMSDRTVLETVDELSLAPESELLAQRLHDVRGIGDTAVAALVDEFDTHHDVESASRYELQQADGIGQKLADRIYRHFSGDGVVTHV